MTRLRREPFSETEILIHEITEAHGWTLDYFASLSARERREKLEFQRWKHDRRAEIVKQALEWRGSDKPYAEQIMVQLLIAMLRLG